MRGRLLAAAVVMLSPLLLGGSGCPHTTPGSSLTPDRDLLAAEIVTLGRDARSGVPVVVLRETDQGRTVPIWIGMAEARAIAAVLEGVEMPRPMTHDLLANLVRELEATLVELQVRELRGATYIGQLTLRLADGAIRRIDCRPSDGLALALRLGAGIRVARQVVEAAPGSEVLPADPEDQVVRLSGMTLALPTAERLAELGLESSATGGVLVMASDGAAAAQGIRAGDRILEVRDRPVSSPNDVLEAVRMVGRGERVRLLLDSRGQRRELRILLVLPDGGPAQVA